MTPFLRGGLAVALLSSIPALPALAAGPPLERLVGTWTALHLERGRLNKISLHLTAVPAAAARPAAQGGGVPVGGDLTYELAEELRRGAVPPSVYPIEGEYFASTGVLRFRRRGAFTDLLAVPDADTKQMAVLFTGAERNTMPMVLAAGAAPPQPLENLDVGGRQRQPTPGIGDMVDAARAARAAREQQEAQRAANADFQRRAMELQQELIKASRANDAARLQQIQQELRELTAQRSRPNAAAPAGRSACPERIVKWAAQLDANGASAADFAGQVQVANLLRPSAFTPFFGKPFAALSANERSDITMDLRLRCQSDGSAFGRGGNITALESAFADTPGFTTREAATAGLALDVIGGWGERSIAALASGGTFEQASDFALHSTQLLEPLWPSEVAALRERTQAVKSDRAAEQLEARIARDAARAATDLAVLREFGTLRYGAEFRALDAADRVRVDERYRRAADSALTAQYAAARRQYSAGDARAMLAASKRWYNDHADLLVTFADQAATQNFVAELGAQRDGAYRAAFDGFATELAGAGTRTAVMAVGAETFLQLDDQRSPAWAEIKDRQRARLAVVDREAFLARVGQGPFGPDHPGAPYLNALYRNDTAQLDAEDRAIASGMLTLMQPVLNSPFMEAMPFFSGGLVSADVFRGALTRSVERATMAKQMAAVFVIGYEHVYKETLSRCMENPQHFEKTTYWETVYTNGFGTTVRTDSGSSVSHYNINGRHVPLFLKVDGETGSADGLDLFSALFSDFLPANVNVALNELGDGMRGIALAMQQRPCDDPVLRRLEDNKLARAMSR